MSEQIPYQLTRRSYLKLAGAATIGFMGLRIGVMPERRSGVFGDPAAGYGPLVKDPRRMLDLPAGFAYRVISTSGDAMDDGLEVPGAPDGMATFPLADGLMALVRNHELRPGSGAFGEGAGKLADFGRGKLYDAGRGNMPCAGGTTTIVYDTANQEVVKQYLSLAGTTRNCAGGPTPWGSWITCEETVERAGEHSRKKKSWFCEKDHGYCFEVPADADGCVEPVPLTAMGRFNHEAVAVDPDTGIVYLTEDRGNGLFYRFIPKTPGKLAEGGQLQVLAVADRPQCDTRNWEQVAMRVGEPVAVTWHDIDNVEAPEDDLRHRGRNKGAAVFARGEGIWYSDNGIYFACTNGGKAHIGQIFKLVPGTGGRPDTLELFIEPNNGELIENADNLTVSPWGDLIVCEDRSGKVVRLVGVTPQGGCYPFAHSHLRTEFAGACFSPDGSTLFVNSQGKGLTFAITGPWKN